MLLSWPHWTVLFLALSTYPATALPVCSGSGIETAIGNAAKASDPCSSAWASCTINPASASAWMLPNSALKGYSSFSEDPSGKKVASSIMEFLGRGDLKTRSPDFKLCEPRTYGATIVIGNSGVQAKKCDLRGIDFTAKFTNPKGRRVIDFSMTLPQLFRLKYLEVDGSAREFSPPFSPLMQNYLRIDIKTCKREGYLPVSLISYLYYPELEERSLGLVPFGMLIRTEMSVSPTEKVKPKQEFKGL